MPSRWKQVDLLALSSVASAGAAARRRANAPFTSAGAGGAASTNGTLRTAVSNAAGGDAGVHGSRGGVTWRGEHFGLFTRSSAATGTAAATATPPAVPLATRVSMARLLGSASLSWQDSLACFVELSERGRSNSGNSITHSTSARDPQHKGCGGAIDTTAGKRQRGALPLEAVVSVLATLRRKEREAAPRWEGAHDTDLEDAPTETEGTRCYSAGEAGQQTGAEGNLLACNSSSGSSLNSQSSTTTSLCFLAYATQHHLALEPIHRLLTAFLDGVSNPALSSHMQNRATHLTRQRSWSDIATQHAALPVETVLRLRRLLSVSTVLHVGLRDVLRCPADVPAASAAVVASPTSCTSSTSSSPSAQACWVAVRVLHHLERYGGAQDYIYALAEGIRVPRVAMSELLGDHDGACVFREPRAERNKDSTERSTRAAHSPHPAAPTSSQTYQAAGSSTTRSAAVATTFTTTTTAAAGASLREAFAVLDTAATLRPQFNYVLDALREAWEVHNDRRLRLATPWASALSSTNEGANTTTTTAEAGESAAITQQLSPSADAAASTNGDAGAALAMVRAIAGTKPSAAFSSHDALPTTANAGAAMSTAELLRTSLDVVRVTWGVKAALRQRKEEPASCAAAVQREQEREGEALVLLMHTATRFMGYVDLCTWLEHLAPPPPARDMSARRAVLSGPEWEALLCLLTRAVRRAPSWSSRCALLRTYWPRLESAGCEDADKMEDTHNVVVTGRTTSSACCGFAACRALREAFFDAPHAPTSTELSLWCRAICTPPRRCDPAKTAALLLPVASPATTTTTMGTQGVLSNTTQSTSPKPPQQQQEAAGEWSQLLYGAHERLLCLSPQQLRRRHAAMTAAAVALSRQWLLPAAELDTVLDGLAACHTQSVEEWAVVMTAQETSLSAAAREAPHVMCDVVAVLADQHRALSSVFLTLVEEFNWLNLVLCRTQRGVARQLVLRAAMLARWNVAASTPPTPSLATAAEARGTAGSAVAVHGAPSPTPSETAMLADLTRVVVRWSSADGAAGNAAMSRSLLSGTAFTPHGSGRLGEVGALYADIVAAVTASTAARSSSAVLDPLCAFVRRSVTKAGLRWEREGHHHSGAAQHVRARSVFMPPLFGSTPLHADDGDAAAVVGRVVDGDTQQARLQEWLDLLRGCPQQLLAQETYAVVWLYVLMRQVEELHVSEGSKTAIAQLGTDVGPPLDVFSLVKEEEGDGLTSGAAAWNAEREATTVRRAAAFLSAQLWSVLPPTSLVPPMLLNWLLTRGGVQSWGEAVRFLRTAAGLPGQGGRTEEDPRSYVYLGLPLDHVVSMAHAVRVLRTLQVVEERYEAAEVDVGLQETRKEGESEEGVGEGEKTALQQGAHDADDAAARGVLLASSAALLEQGEERCCQHAPTQQHQREDQEALGHPELRTYYREIERVLLRAWYRRALTAVLFFLAAHPAHVSLTTVAAAPDHAALTLHRRLFRRGDAVEASWRAAVGLPRVKTAAATSRVTTEEADSASSCPSRAAARSVEHRIVSKTLDSGLSGESMAAGETARADVNAHSGGVSSGEVARGDAHLHGSSTATPPLRIPLHLLGSFILQESRMHAPAPPKRPPLVVTAPEAAAPPFSPSGKDCYTTAFTTTTSTTAAAATAATAKGTGASLQSRSTLDSLLAEAQRLLTPASTRGDIYAAPSASSLGREWANSVHPELLRLYRKALDAKTAELGTSMESPADTVESAVYDVLAHHAGASVGEPR